jgi:phosphate starvation-inducible PhoH-like protein
MKMFLTRIGFGSKAVVTGDITQIDLQRGQKSGLVEAREVLSKVRGIVFSYFESEDVVRHPLVQRIVNAYESHVFSAPKTAARRDKKP